jgi:predicted nucleotidyltransferase
MNVIAGQAQQIAALCRRFHVARLDVIGSARSGRFDPRSSDIDFVVEFTEHGRSRAFDNYFGLKEALTALFGRPVDLITRSSIRNPIFRAEVEQTAELIYAETN